MGTRFGRWTVFGDDRVDSGGNRTFLCKCDCGTFSHVNLNNMRRGLTTSCGCFRREFSKAQATTHGASKSGEKWPEYNVWNAMRERCADQNSKSYGGRGIAVCDRWKHSFECFIEDMGRRPSDNHSVDRIDNDADYCPENCRWANREQQQRNKRTNRLIRAFGITRCLVDWASISGIPREAISGRLKRGWAPERAVTEPAISLRKSKQPLPES